MERLAAILTCYNRKAQTLACLGALFSQVDGVTVYLVDDGSTDGTGAAVEAAYPDVRVIQGTGSLFWNGGMRLGFGMALAGNYDGYLWLNDDTVLYPGAIASLLTTAESLPTPAIITGSTQDPRSHVFTYGGMRQIHPLFPPFKVRPVMPQDQPQRCDLMCGNIVLIPRAIAHHLGNLDPHLTHYAGDWDYGLRAKQAGFPIWVAPGYQGSCADNPRPIPNLAQVEKLSQPKGMMLADVTLHPWQEWKLLMRRHGGWLWPVFWLLPYRRVALQLLWQQLRGN